MTTKKSDEKKAQKRYIDQPGQWVDKTPASVKRRQANDWKKLEKMIKERKSKKK